jgi:murein DD-endopeptidase MepM/ murein hydrolase activator NlpD
LEALNYPADELYGGWDTLWVNPFRSKEVLFPDSFNIDCTSFVIPIDNDLKVTSPYGPRRRRMHLGIDLKVQIGDTIRAAFDGKIRIKNFERRGYGNYLVMRHPNGLETVYGHLSKFLVTENDIVKAGQPIALGGNTGRSTGPHLHFETRFLGQALDPSTLIDFTNGTPHEDLFTIHKNKVGKVSNIYTSTSERIVYHRVKSGDNLGKIAQMYRTSVSELCRLNGLSATSTLRIGQSIRCGTVVEKKKEDDKSKESSVSTAPSDTIRQIAAAYHEVKANETLNSIARQHGTTVDAICRLNNIHSTTPLRLGQSICYRAAKPVMNRKENVQAAVENNQPAGETAAAPAEKDEVVIVSALEKAKKNAAPNETPQQETAQSETPVITEIPAYHNVQKEETLYSISRRYGMDVELLCSLNGITENTPLKVGQRLRCKDNGQQVSSAKEDNTVKQNKVAQPEPNKTYYRIKQGDTLGGIAQRHGVSVSKLCELNGITKTTILKVGRSLRCS